MDLPGVQLSMPSVSAWLSDDDTNPSTLAIGGAIGGTAAGATLHRVMPTTSFGPIQKLWVPAVAGLLAAGAGATAAVGLDALRDSTGADADLLDAAVGAAGLATAGVLSRGSAFTRSNPAAFARMAGGVVAGAAIADAGIRHGGSLIEQGGLLEGDGARAAAVGLVTVAGSAAAYAATRRINTLNPTFTGERAFGHALGTRITDAPPVTPLSTVSLGAASAVPQDTIGKITRKFLEGAIPAEQITARTGRPAVDPVRIAIDFKSASPGAPRVEMLRDEIRRLGVIGGENHRDKIVMISPAGALPDYVATDARELLSDGNVAHLMMSFSNKPALQSGPMLREGIEQFRMGVKMVRGEIDALPPELRPDLEVYGESVGALVGQQAVLKQGIAGLDDLGVSRAVFVGAPSGGRAQRAMLKAEGAVDTPRAAEYASLDDLLARYDETTRDGLRVHFLKHTEDAVSVIRPRRIWQATPIPDGSVVRNQASHIPFVSFAHMVGDAINFTTPPGRLGMRGHNYSADMPGVMRQFHPDVDDARMAGVVDGVRHQEASRHGLADLPELPPAFNDGSGAIAPEGLR